MRSNTKEQILDVADELVATRGFDNLSYADIAHRLGIRTASVHHHFPRKQDLGLAFIRRLRDRLRRELHEIGSSSLGALEQLDRFFATGRRALESHLGATCPMASLLADYTLISEEMRRELAMATRMELGFVARRLRDGREAGELELTGAPDAAALLIIAAYRGALLYARSQGIEIFDTTVEQLRAGLAPA